MVIPKIWIYPAVLLLGLAAGCASVPADWGRADADKVVAANGLTMPRTDNAQTFTREALGKPLDAATAVQLALLNNPRLRQSSAQLGFAAADVYEAGRLANPTFSLTRLTPGNSALPAAQLTMEVAFNFINLLFLPANQRYADARFEAAKLDMASSAMDLASDVTVAWYAAVGADQLMQMRAASARAQQASATLARRYFDAGNINARALAMEDAAASEAMLASLSAQAKAVETKTALNQLMGLPADADHWTLDAKLPLPPEKTPSLDELQQLALKSRLDIQALQKNSQALADRYGLVRKTRLIESLQIGVVRERDYDRAVNIGPTLSLELPLFNWGTGRTTMAQAALKQTEAELDARVIGMSNGVKLAAAHLAISKAMSAEYRDKLIPSREAAVARAQEQQNYMLIGVFEVITAKQQEYAAYAGYIEAVRDYWIANAELARAVGRSLPVESIASIDAAAILEPKSEDQDMEGMDMKDMHHGDHQ